MNNIVNQKKIAILSCVSFNENIVFRQLDNYKLSHGDNAHHFLHVANGGDICSKNLNSYYNFVSAKSSKYPTSNKCNFGGQIANSERLLSSINKSDFSHVYLHTDADLIIKGNIHSYVKQNNIAFNRKIVGKNWIHNERMLNDPHFKSIRKYLNIPNEKIFGGRQEGSFFPIELWEEMHNIFTKFYNIDFFKNNQLTWPVEECLYPTLASILMDDEHPKKSIGQITVQTKKINHIIKGQNPRDIDDNCVKIEDINDSLQSLPNQDCIAMKWFSKKINDSAAIYANKTLKESLNL